MAEDIAHEDERWRARYAAAAAAMDSAVEVVTLRRATEQHMAGNPLTWMVPPAQTTVTEGDTGSGLRQARSVGLFSASFNPLTEAHVALVDAARAAGLDLVLWAMARVTVDKERVERATTADRLAQVGALLRRRAGEALTLLGHGLYVEQARAVRAEMAPEARLVILLGYDKIVQIFDPRYYDDRERALTDLFALAEIWVAPRVGGGEDDLRRLLAQPANAPYAAHVRYLPLPERYARDSSTEARDRAATTPDPARDPALRALLPPEGLALTALGPYAPVSENPSDEYTLREAWVRALEALPDEALARVGSLDALVRRTRAVIAGGTPEGAALGRWLAGDGVTSETTQRWLTALERAS